MHRRRSHAQRWSSARVGGCRAARVPARRRLRSRCGDRRSGGSVQASRPGSRARGGLWIGTLDHRHRAWRHFGLVWSGAAQEIGPDSRGRGGMHADRAGRLRPERDIPRYAGRSPGDALRIDPQCGKADQVVVRDYAVFPASADESTTESANCIQRGDHPRHWSETPTQLRSFALSAGVGGWSSGLLCVLTFAGGLLANEHRDGGGIGRHVPPLELP